MSTLPAPRPASKVAEAQALAPPSAWPVETTLTIQGVAYHVRSLSLHPEFGTCAYRLSKRSGDFAIYDVVRTAAGVVECDCASYEFNCRGTLGLCKHGRAVVEAGLLERPGQPAPARPSIPGVTRVRDEFDEPADVRPMPSQRPGFAEELAAAVERAGETVIPTEGEGRGDAGEDLGPADPIDDLTADDLADGDDQADADWDDDAVWNLGPAPATFTMAQVVEMQVRGYEAWGNELGDILAHHMKALADELGIVRASTPDQWLDRRAVLDAAV